MDNLTRLYRVYKTCLELLRDRGYIISQEELAMTKETFREKNGDEPKRDELAFSVVQQDDPTDRIMVFFPEEPKVGVKTIKHLADKMKDSEAQKALMVVQSNMTPFAKQCLQEMQPKYMIELFKEEELLVNITQHVLVPEHRTLSLEEKKTLLERYKIKDTQLPRIQFNDPVARYYGVQRGEVVRIVRPSETAGRYVTYRLCV